MVLETLTSEKHIFARFCSFQFPIKTALTKARSNLLNRELA